MKYQLKLNMVMPINITHCSMSICIEFSYDSSPLLSITSFLLSRNRCIFQIVNASGIILEWTSMSLRCYQHQNVVWFVAEKESFVCNKRTASSSIYLSWWLNAHVTARGAAWLYNTTLGNGYSCTSYDENVKGCKNILLTGRIIREPEWTVIAWN